MSSARVCQSVLHSSLHVCPVRTICARQRASRRLVMAQAAATKDLKAKFEQLQAHNKQAARPSKAETVRTLLANTKYGTLCTLSAATDSAGFPNGAVAPFSIDGQGRITVALSDLSQHKRYAHTKSEFHECPKARRSCCFDYTVACTFVPFLLDAPKQCPRGFCKRNCCLHA